MYATGGIDAHHSTLTHRDTGAILEAGDCWNVVVLQSADYQLREMPNGAQLGAGSGPSPRGPTGVTKAG